MVQHITDGSSRTSSLPMWIDVVSLGFKGWVEVTSLLSRDGVFMLAMWFCLSSFFSLFTGNISLAGVATFVASECFVLSRGILPE